MKRGRTVLLKLFSQVLQYYMYNSFVVFVGNFYLLFSLCFGRGVIILVFFLFKGALYLSSLAGTVKLVWAIVEKVKNAHLYIFV